MFKNIWILRKLRRVMLKILWKLEERFMFKILRACRGALLGGHARDATLDDIAIIHESPHFLVLNKHHDVLINSVNRELVTVERQLERLYPDLVNKKLPFGFYFPHRLDYSTSGTLCIAKSKRACAAAVAAFEKRNTEKYYLAIVRGYISQDFLTLTEAVGRDTREQYAKVRMASETMPYCDKVTRAAKTHLIVVERGICYGYPATKVLLRPITGRRHQLRLHCHTLGHTIVGDFTYSNKKDLFPYRMFLHAYKLMINSKLESINVTTSDPFLPTDPRNEWEPHQTVLSIEDAIYELSCKTKL